MTTGYSYTSIIQNIVRRNSSGVGLPSIVLHAFCFLCVLTLSLFTEQKSLLLYFAIPVLFFLIPIYIYTSNKVATYMFSQYIYMCAFIVASIKAPVSMSSYLMLLPVIFFIVKLRVRADLPPLGPAFFYIFWVQVLSSSGIEAVLVLSNLSFIVLILALKNKNHFLPLFFTTAIVYSVYFHPIGETHTLREEFLSAVFCILTAYVCRFRRRSNSQNVRYTSIEEILIGLLISGVAAGATILDTWQSMAITSVFYLCFAIGARFRSNPGLSQVGWSAAQVLAFSAIWSFDGYNFSVDGHIEKTALSILLALTSFYIKKAIKIHDTLFFTRFLLTIAAGLLLRSANDHMQDWGSLTSYFIMNFALSISLVFLFHVGDIEDESITWKTIVRYRELAVFRQWARGAKSAIGTIPIFGTFVFVINYIAGNLREGFGNKRYFTSSEAALILMFILQTIFFAEWSIDIFSQMKIGVETITLEDGTTKINRIEDSAMAIRLASYSFFGSLVVLFGGITRQTSYIGIGLFVPAFLIFLLFVGSLIDGSLPFTIFLLALSLLYIGARYGIETFSSDVTKNVPEYVRSNHQGKEENKLGDGSNIQLPRYSTAIISFSSHDATKEFQFQKEQSNDAIKIWISQQHQSQLDNDGYPPKSVQTQRLKQVGHDEFIYADNGFGIFYNDGFVDLLRSLDIWSIIITCENVDAKVVAAVRNAEKNSFEVAVHKIKE